jgi:hypothetical protein
VGPLTAEIWITPFEESSELLTTGLATVLCASIAVGHAIISQGCCQNNIM